MNNVHIYRSNLTKGDIDELENLDKIYIRRILEVPSSTPIPALYLELGVIPVRFKIQAKRLMFFHYLLSRDVNELTSQVLKAQIEDPIKGDWILTVKDDLEVFELGFLSVDALKLIKKEKFKEMVKKACKKVAFNYLIKEKNKKSKLSELKYNDLNMQSYFQTHLISKRKQILLFKFRSRMINVGANFGNHACYYATQFLIWRREAPPLPPSQKFGCSSVVLILGNFTKIE